MATEEESRQFETWDWVVFALMLGVSAAIGIYYALKVIWHKYYYIVSRRGCIGVEPKLIYLYKTLLLL